MGPEGAGLMNTGCFEGRVHAWSFVTGASGKSKSSYSSGGKSKAWLLKPCLAVASMDAYMSHVVEGAGPC